MPERFCFKSAFITLKVTYMDYLLDLFLSLYTWLHKWYANSQQNWTIPLFCHQFAILYISFRPDELNYSYNRILHQIRYVITNHWIYLLTLMHACMHACIHACTQHTLYMLCTSQDLVQVITHTKCLKDFVSNLLSLPSK